MPANLMREHASTIRWISSDGSSKVCQAQQNHNVLQLSTTAVNDLQEWNTRI